MGGLRETVAAALVLGCFSAAVADPLPRTSPAAGSVIARKTGEEVRFIDVSNWRGVDIHQDLLAGDVLRTNALGSLAVLFSDSTQIRLGRNTTMVVKDVTPGADSAFSLESGSLWARAERGGEGLVIETPAAAAAIRGTDWTMTVDGDRTSLVVLEGVVELSNPQGSVSVARGEAASARIGQAPAKVVIVDPDDREQMLFYLSLRTGFSALPVTPLSSTDIISERARIVALPEEARSGEDWLTLAEVSMPVDGADAARAAAQRARTFRLSASDKARLDLIDAMLAASEKRYEDAAALFARAQPRLTGDRRAVAAYGGYFARSLTDPNHVETPPSVPGGGPYGALAQAFTAGFLKDIPAAIEVLRRAEQRYPKDATLPAARAQFALLIDDRDQVKEAVERALSLDPNHPSALEARANYRAGIEGDLEGALADLEHAVQVTPGSSSIWNALGLVQGARGASRESEAALLKAIALDPQDPVSHANLAILYLDQNRLAEAKREIDIAIASDPEFDIGLVARGSYYLKTGDLDKARQDLLAGSTANPAYAQALLLLAAAYSESGEREPAEQALQNADRLDPNDPVTSTFETALAIDGYQSDRAIRAAQESLKRARARGGDFASLRASRDQGSTLNQAYRLQGLDAWGRYYGDAVFDPFSASALVDQGVAGSPAAFVNSLNYGTFAGDPALNSQSFGSIVQALLLDPQMLSAPSRGPGLVQRPFIEATVGGGGITGAADGWTADAELQGYVAYPFPVSFYGQFTGRDSAETREGHMTAAGTPSARFDLDEKAYAGTGYVTAQPTPNDRIVAFANVQNLESRLANAFFTPEPAIPIGGGFNLTGVAYDRVVEDDTSSYGGAWSHTFGYRNVVSGGVFLSGFDRTSTEAAALGIENGDIQIIGSSGLNVDYTQDSVIGAVNHTYGIGDLTLRYGAEGGTFRQTRDEIAITLLPGGQPETTRTTTDFDLDAGRAYLDAIYELTPDLKLEGGVFGTMLDGEGLEEQRLEPRLGAAWSPIEGHYLRAGYLREGSRINASTLEPIGIVGLQSNQLPLDVGGYSDTFAARWDAQWTDHLFTAVDYQHQDVNDLAIPVPASLDELGLSEGRIDRLNLTANVWLTHGFGAFASYSRNWSQNTTPGFGDAPIPFVPDSVARFGLTWVHPSDLKVTVAATYVGERGGDILGTATLGDYWTADAFATWEPFDKRFTLELAAYNLFDEDFEVAPFIPGWGRTFTGSLKLRF